MHNAYNSMPWNAHILIIIKNHPHTHKPTRTHTYDTHMHTCVHICTPTCTHVDIVHTHNTHILIVMPRSAQTIGILIAGL
jgi:hypothetical protein